MFRVVGDGGLYATCALLLVNGFHRLGSFPTR